MKKSILILISSFLILTIFAIVVNAAGVQATVDNKSCAKGGTVTLEVNVSGELKAGGIEVIYDSAVLELISGEWKTDGSLMSTFNKETKQGVFTYMDNQKFNGKIFAVTFKVRDDAPIGSTTVKCELQLRKDVDGVEVVVPVTNIAGSINVTCKHNFNSKTNEFKVSDATCTSPELYNYACSICGERGTATYTVGAALPHTFDKEVTTSDYLVKNVKCKDTAEYYYSCSCGAKGTTKFTADASWSHQYDNNWFISSEEHWHQCIDCGAKKEVSAHTPNSQSICDKCQFVVVGDVHYHSFDSDWKSNNSAHWHECSCGLKNDMSLHNYDGGVVKGNQVTYTCGDCGAKKAETIPHEHSFSNDWSKNDAAHWHVCSCGYINDMTAHNYGKGEVTKEATENSVGEKVFVCKDCGQKKIEVLAKLPKPVVNTIEAPIGLKKLVVIAGAGAVALLIGEVIIFAIYKVISKKKKAKKQEIFEEASDVETANNDPMSTYHYTYDNITYQPESYDKEQTNVETQDNSQE